MEDQCLQLFMIMSWSYDLRFGIGYGDFMTIKSYVVDYMAVYRYMTSPSVSYYTKSFLIHYK